MVILGYKNCSWPNYCGGNAFLSSTLHSPVGYQVACGLSGSDTCTMSTNTSDPPVSIVNYRKINLSTNHVSATIPSEIALLSNIISLVFTHASQLSGTIPSEFCLLSLLSYFALGEASPLSGSLPAEMGQLESLFTFSFVSMLLVSGSLPSSFGSVRELDIRHVPFLSGSIGLRGQFSELRFLRIIGTSISGTIPTEIAKLSNMKTL